MSTVDTRVVEMQFNNKRFEQNAKQTMSTLDKLKEKLKFKGSDDGLRELQNASNSFSMDHIANAVDNIGDKFTLMGQIGMKAMGRIADAAVNAGISLVKSLSVDQISAGMSKYEQETNIVQTLYGSLKPKGTQLSEIYAVLDDLASYSDETSYSYTQMADAISKFVNAGIDLKDSEVMIEGIANAAAKAGIGIHDTEIIFRNFSDAMNKGRMQLMDWRSLQLSHIDTEWFKEAFIEEAINLGKLSKDGKVLVKEAKKNAKGVITAAAEYKDVRTNFGDTLVKGWLDVEVMEAVLKKYATRDLEGFGKEAFAAAQNAKTFTDVIDAVKDSVATGWSNSFRIMFGDLEEAIAFFTPMANTVIEFTASIDEARNKMLQGWKDAGGRDSMIGALKTVWDIFLDISSFVKRGFRTGFDVGWITSSGSALVSFTNAIKSAVDGVYAFLTDSSVGINLVWIFEAVGTSLSQVASIADGVSSFVGDIIKQLEPFFKGTIGLFGEIGKDITKFFLSLNRAGTIGKIFKKLAAAFNPIAKRLTQISEKAKDLYISLRNWVKSNPQIQSMLKAFSESFWAMLDFLPKAVESVLAFGESIVKTVKDSSEWKTITNAFNKYVKPVVKSISDLATKVAEDWAAFFGMDTGADGTLWDKIKKRFSVFDNLGPWFDQEWAKLKQKFPILKEIEDWWNTSPIIRELKLFASVFSTAFDAIMGTETEGNSLAEKMKARIDAFTNIMGPYFTEKWAQLKKKYPVLQSIETWWNDSALKVFFEEKKKIIGDFFDGLFKPEVDPETGESVGIFEKIKKSIEDLFTPKTDPESDGDVGIFGKIKQWFQKSTESLFSSLSDIWERVKAGSPLITEIIEWVNAIFGPRVTDSADKGDAGKLKTVGEAIVEALGPVFEKIKEWVQSLTWKDVWFIVKIVGGILSIIKIIKTMGKGVKTAFDTVDAVNNILNTLSGNMEQTPTQKKTWKRIGFLAFAAGIRLLADAVAKLSEIPVDKVGQGLFVVGMLILEMTGAVAIIEKASSGSSFSGAFTALFGAIGVMMLMGKYTKVIKDLENVDSNKMRAITACLDSLILVSAAYNYVTGMTAKGAGAVEALTGAIGVVLIMGKYAKVVKKLEDVDPTKLSTITVCIDSLILFSGFYNALSGLSNGAGAVEAITGAIGVVLIMGKYAKVVKTLEDVDQNKLITITSCIDSLVLLTGLTNLMTGLTATPESIVAEIVGYLGVIGVMREFTECIKQLEDVPAELLISFGVAVDLIVAAVGGIALIAGAIGKVQGAEVAVIKGAVIIGLISVIASIVAGITGDIFAGISDDIAVIGANLSQYSDMAKGIDMDAIGNSVTMVKDLASAFAEVGTKDYGNLETFRTNLSRMGGSLTLFGINTALFDTEKAKGITTALKDMATDLSGFPEVSDVGTSIANIGGAIKLYAESLNGVTFGEETPDSTAIAKVFDALKGAIPNDENLTEVAAFADKGKGDEMTNFAIGLENIATAVSSFSTTAATLDFTNMTEAIAALDSIASLSGHLGETTISATTGFGTFGVTVTNQAGNLTTFATDVVLLGGSLEAFGTSIGKVKVDDLKAGAGVLEQIVDLNSKLPPEGGISQWLNGTQSLTRFSANLKLLGNGAKAFGLAISGGSFDADLAAAAGAALVKIADVNDELPETGGWKQILAGQQDLGFFGENLTKLGEGTKNFCEAIGTESFNSSNIEAAGKALLAIVDVNNKLPDTGGLAQMFVGEKSLDNFGDNLSALGTGAAAFANATKGVDFSGNVEDAMKFILKMVNSQVRLSKLEFMYSMGTFAQELNAAATELVQLNGQIKGVTWEDTTALENLLDWAIGEQVKLGGTQYNKSLKNIGEDIRDFFNAINGVNNWLDGNKLERISGAASSVFDSINKTFTLGGEDGTYDGIGTMILDGITSGFYSETSLNKVTYAINVVNQAIIDKIRNDRTNFRNIGTWIPAGVGEGIRANKYAAINAAIIMMTEAILAVRRIGRIASPSKEFEEIGMYMDLGLAQGFQRYSQVVDNAAGEVSKNAILSVAKEMNDIQNLPLDNLEWTPTVRPVLDVSNIKENATSIDEMLSGIKGVGVNTRKMEIQAQLIGGDTKNDLSGIMQKVQDTADRLDELRETIVKMRIVLDTGAMVGGLKDEMDRQLGSKARLGRRGN